MASDNPHLGGLKDIAALLHEDVLGSIFPDAVVLAALGAEGDVRLSRGNAGLLCVVVREAPLVLAVCGNMESIPEDAVLRHAVLLEAPLIAVEVILGYVEADCPDSLKAFDSLKLEARELEDRELGRVLKEREHRDADVGAGLCLNPRCLSHEAEQGRDGALAVRARNG